MDREAIRGMPILRLEPADEETITTYRCDTYDEALKSIRARAREMDITDEDIGVEIRAAPEDKS